MFPYVQSLRFTTFQFAIDITLQFIARIPRTTWLNNFPLPIADLTADQTKNTPKMARTKSVYFCYQTKGETYGDIGAATHPKIKNGIFSGNFLGFSYISRAILKSFIYVALLLLLFAPAKYYVAYEK